MKTQQEIVFKIIKDNQPVRTEQVKIKAMYEGVSCADRYIRWLQEEGKIYGYFEGKNRTKTWVEVLNYE